MAVEVTIKDGVTTIVEITMNRYEGHACPICKCGTVWVEGMSTYAHSIGGRADYKIGQEYTLRMDCGCLLTQQQFFDVIGGSALHLVTERPIDTSRSERIERLARAAYADWSASKGDWGSEELRVAIHACFDEGDFEEETDD